MSYNLNNKIWLCFQILIFYKLGIRKLIYKSKAINFSSDFERLIGSHSYANKLFLKIFFEVYPNKKSCHLLAAVCVGF